MMKEEKRVDRRIGDFMVVGRGTKTGMSSTEIDSGASFSRGGGPLLKESPSVVLQPRL